MRHPNEVRLFQAGLGGLRASLVDHFPEPESQLSPEGFVLWVNHFDSQAPQPLSQAHRQVFQDQFQAQQAGVAR